MNSSNCNSNVWSSACCFFMILPLLSLLLSYVYTHRLQERCFKQSLNQTQSPHLQPTLTQLEAAKASWRRMPGSQLRRCPLSRTDLHMVGSIPGLWGNPKGRTPNSGHQYSYGVVYRTRGLGVWDIETSTPHGMHSPTLHMTPGDPDEILVITTILHDFKFQKIL